MSVSKQTFYFIGKEDVEIYIYTHTYIYTICIHIYTHTLYIYTYTQWTMNDITYMWNLKYDTN